MVLRKHRLTMSRYYHIQLLCVFVIPSLFVSQITPMYEYNTLHIIYINGYTYNIDTQ